MILCKQVEPLKARKVHYSFSLTPTTINKDKDTKTISLRKKRKVFNRHTSSHKEMSFKFLRFRLSRKVAGESTLPCHLRKSKGNMEEVLVEDRAVPALTVEAVGECD